VWDGARPVRLNGEYVRDEAEQATYLHEVLDVFEAEGVDNRKRKPRKRLSALLMSAFQLRLLLTLRERATPIVRSRPSSVHMDFGWLKRTLWETRNTALKNHAEAEFIIAGRREPSERSASY